MTDSAASPSRPVPPAPADPGARGRPALREPLAGAEARLDRLGRKVREVWVGWASRRPNPKPSHLTPWGQLDEDNREVDRLIGAALAEEGRTEAVRGLEFEDTCLSCGRMYEECHRTDLRRERAEAALAEAVALADAYFDLVGEVLTKFHDFDRETRLVRTRPLPWERVRDWRATANDLAERLERARPALGQETENADG